MRKTVLVLNVMSSLLFIVSAILNWLAGNKLLMALNILVAGMLALVAVLNSRILRKK